MLNRQAITEGLAKLGIKVEGIKPPDAEFPYPYVLVNNLDYYKLQKLSFTIGHTKPHGDMVWCNIMLHKIKWIEAGK